MTKVLAGSTALLLLIVIVQSAYVLRVQRDSAAFRAQVEITLGERKAAHDALQDGYRMLEQQYAIVSDSVRQARQSVQRQAENFRRQTEDQREAVAERGLSAEEKVQRFEWLVAGLDSVVAAQAMVIESYEYELGLELQRRLNAQSALDIALSRIDDLERLLRHAPAVQAAPRATGKIAVAGLVGAAVGVLTSLILK